MAYADLEFYKTKYYGSMVPDEDFARMAERASDWLDVITFDRLAAQLPTDERSQTKIRKAVCAVADEMYQIELAQKQASSGINTQVTAAGETTGIVKQVSAGSESVSYATPAEIAGSANQYNAAYQAAGDISKTNALLMSVAKQYLMGVQDDNGVLLLYAGLGVL